MRPDGTSTDDAGTYQAHHILTQARWSLARTYTTEDLQEAIRLKEKEARESDERAAAATAKKKVKEDDAVLAMLTLRKAAKNGNIEAAQVLLNLSK